jgi:hypothetical protein
MQQLAPAVDSCMSASLKNIFVIGETLSPFMQWSRTIDLGVTGKQETDSTAACA